jgi:hypothetical protein
MLHSNLLLYLVQGITTNTTIPVINNTINTTIPILALYYDTTVVIGISNYDHTHTLVIVVSTMTVLKY